MVLSLVNGSWHVCGASCFANVSARMSATLAPWSINAWKQWWSKCLQKKSFFVCFSWTHINMVLYSYHCNRSLLQISMKILSGSNFEIHTLLNLLISHFNKIQIQLQNSIFKHFETVTTNLLSLTFKTLANVSNSENSKASWHILPLLYNYKLYIHVKTSCKISVISYFTMSCKTFFEHTKSLWGENVHMYSVYKIQITASWYQVTPITNFINSKYIHKMMHI